MILYALKHKKTGKLAQLDVCGDCTYLVDDTDTALFPYTESNINDVKDALANSNDDIYTYIKPDDYEIVKFVLK
ncbi:hypothetical protein P19_0251 [Aeromonas phage P19]|uniref:Uncharacterized protein n=1 Tax=Aeromonas phage vB_AdhaM_G2 TaxID=3238786 RepID=A0AB39TZW7_9CAUD|nr:hypothetical protein P19_0251 [Aeromonas phage P19]